MNSIRDPVAALWSLRVVSLFSMVKQLLKYVMNHWVEQMYMISNVKVTWLPYRGSPYVWMESVLYCYNFLCERHKQCHEVCWAAYCCKRFVYRWCKKVIGKHILDAHGTAFRLSSATRNINLCLRINIWKYSKNVLYHLHGAAPKRKINN